MNVLKLIILREFLTKIRNKSFIIMTFLSPLLVVGLISLVTYLKYIGDSKVTHIGINDQSGLFIKEFKSDAVKKYHDVSDLTFDKISQDSLLGEYEGILFIPKSENIQDYQKTITYQSDKDPSLDLVGDLEKIIANKITFKNFEAKGINSQEVENSKAKVSINVKKSTGDQDVKGIKEIKMFIGFGFGYLIMMFIVIYGNMIMRSVIEEKTNRIVEIIISSIKPRYLMFGKIIGTTLAALLQFVIWAIISGGLIFIIKSQTVSLENMDQGIINLLNSFINLPLASYLIFGFLFFIAGFLLYSSIYAAIGAAVDNETDSQQFMMPILMPLMLAFYVGVTVVIKDPHGTISVIFSMIPYTSPIMMLMRIPYNVPMYQIIISLLILISTISLNIWFSGKIYRIGILMYNSKPTWKQLLKWLKY